MAEIAECTGHPVDLVDPRITGEPLLGQILKYGKRILGKDSAYAELIKRHVFDEAAFYALLSWNSQGKAECMDREVIEQKLGSLRRCLQRTQQ